MTRFARLLVGALLLFTTGCASRIDLAAATQALLDTDRAWGRLADADGPVDNIVAYWTPDARVILAGQPVVVGTEAIRQMITGTRAIPGFHIAWTRDSAVVSPGGDFGYTCGTNRITAPEVGGALRTAIGRYITVWRKELDGSWRCAIDISNEGPLAR